MDGPTHRLDAGCPDCGDAQWLHGKDGCLKLKRTTKHGGPLKKCRCRKTTEAFA